MTSYIPLLAVQQRDHRIGYDMPVRAYSTGGEAAAASAAARARLRRPMLLAAPKPHSKAVASVRLPRDIISVSVPAAVDIPMTPAQRIIRDICQKHGVTMGELLSARRARPLVAARHEAMYRLSKETSMSLPAIGRRMGGRDHTTVIHGVRKHAALMEASAQ